MTTPSIGAVARMDAMLAGDPDWQEVTRWPDTPAQHALAELHRRHPKPAPQVDRNPDSPWLLVTIGADDYAIWKSTGNIHLMHAGAVFDDPKWTPPAK